MSEIADAMNTGFAKLAELVDQYGPPAIDTAAHVVQINAAGHLASGVLALGVCAGAVHYALKFFAMEKNAAVVWEAYKEREAAYRRHRDHPNLHPTPATKPVQPLGPDDDTLSWAFAAMCFLAAASFAYATCNLLNTWSWVALFDPKLALAAKIVNQLPGF